MGTLSAIKPEQAESRAASGLLDALMMALEPRMREIAEETVRAEEDLRSFSFKTAMERLDVSEYILRKMISEGKLETVRPTADTVRITARSLRRFLCGDKVTDALASPSKEKP